MCIRDSVDTAQQITTQAVECKTIIDRSYTDSDSESLYWIRQICRIEFPVAGEFPLETGKLRFMLTKAMTVIKPLAIRLVRSKYRNVASHDDIDVTC